MGSNHRPSDMSTILDTIDFLDKSQNLLKAARKAARKARKRARKLERLPIRNPCVRLRSFAKS